MKPYSELNVHDLIADPIWRFVNDDELDEITVRPVRRLPVRSLRGKLAGPRVTLANGGLVWAILGNVNEGDPRATAHFSTLAVHRDGRWFELAWYFDVDYESRGPLQLAEFLGARVDEIFPIRYDLRAHVKGEPPTLVGVVQRESTKELSLEERLRLHFDKKP
jgi:hypothetical protein